MATAIRDVLSVDAGSGNYTADLGQFNWSVAPCNRSLAEASFDVSLHYGLANQTYEKNECVNIDTAAGFVAYGRNQLLQENSTVLRGVLAMPGGYVFRAADNREAKNARCSEVVSHRASPDAGPSDADWLDAWKACREGERRRRRKANATGSLVEGEGCRVEVSRLPLYTCYPPGRAVRARVYLVEPGRGGGCADGEVCAGRRAAAAVVTAAGDPMVVETFSFGGLPPGSAYCACVDVLHEFCLSDGLRDGPDYNNCKSYHPDVIECA